MNSSRRFAALAGAALMAGLVVSGPTTQAAEASDYWTRSEAVPYSDLDLTSDAGVRVLYSRLVAAAKRVCGVRDSLNMRAETRWRVCYQEALEDAVAGTGVQALVAAHHSALSGRTDRSRSRGCETDAIAAR